MVRPSQNLGRPSDGWEAPSKPPSLRREVPIDSGGNLCYNALVYTSRQVGQAATVGDGFYPLNRQVSSGKGCVVRIIDKANPIPYYQQLADLLRREIVEREAQDEVYQLPSENELAERHGITRATVRHALDVLEQDGWIYREKGKGSFAAIRRVEHELTQLVSTTEDMRRRGWSLSTQVVSLEQIPSVPYVAHALELSEGSPVYELYRLRFVDGEPLSLQTAYLPVELCPNLEENDLTSSLYRLLETRYGLRLWTGQETLRARCATPHEARLLRIKENMPMMYMERVTFAANGVAVEYLEAVWRGDRYDFKVTLSRP